RPALAGVYRPAGKLHPGPSGTVGRGHRRIAVMAASLQLDHLVIRVHDLDQAVKDFTALGFTVTLGGEHPGWGSRNALIPFADGSYLELIAFPTSSPAEPIPKQVRAAELAAAGHSALECRVLPWVSAGEGMVDFALVP